MKLRMIIAALVAAAVLAASSTPAFAARMLIELRGTLEAFEGTAGVFGSTEPVEGDEYIARFTLTLPTPSSNRVTSETIDYAGGGYNMDDFLVAPMTATLTINGATVAFGGTARSIAVAMHEDAAQANPDEPDAIYYDVLEYAIVDGLELHRALGFSLLSYDSDLFDTPSLETPLSLGADRGEVEGGFYIEGFDSDAQARTFFARGILGGLQSVTTTVLPDLTPAVPEPASWAMMIAGFGLVGGMMRRSVGKREGQVP